ncbi:MAG: 4-hydroxy-3-methylbut-2-en-1-yl diphosphate synthase [Calditrichaeota bacterium]|nr:MAG: 4-hydroxy-3-methylbut-2-en-1-yl diphosphate synthase [Calditrichota bacterium]
MQKYCENNFSWKRRPTRVVNVGDVPVGGNNPIRIQSMTISHTMDTEKTVKEAIELYEAGCEVVRITAPSLKEAQNLKNIREAIHKRGYKIPLVADIHFKPDAAMIAADFVDKVRINPGNFADKKKFAILEYTDSEYQAELERIEKKFAPLVKKCKTNGVSMRIGTNHGSLSDRIMNRFGDTPEGMVESALEFVRICESYNYKDLIISMKASNAQVMIQAYRLLASRMYEFGMDYPFHLGVTEAGDGEDGRIKSAVGIGSLLEDGIGDTIRVSLTEDSIHEIPVAYALAKKYNQFISSEGLTSSSGSQSESKLRASLGVRHSEISEKRNPFVYEKRETIELQNGTFNFGGNYTLPVETQFFEDFEHFPETVKIINDCLKAESKTEIIRFWIEESEAEKFETFVKKAQKLNSDFFNALTVESSSAKVFEKFKSVASKFALLVENGTKNSTLTQSISFAKNSERLLEICFKIDSDSTFEILEEKLNSILKTDFENLTFSFKTSPGISSVPFYRFLTAFLENKESKLPITLIANTFGEEEEQLLRSATEIGSLLCDGIGDSVLVVGSGNPEILARVSYGILQATRTRISKTDFISCPSCGRTLFDLQEVTEKIKKRTDHLVGVKIAIMGCIVNGPGEMADADFGYVGSVPGKINLFVGKECVKTGIPEIEAVDRLVDLIKENDKWIEKV